MKKMIISLLLTVSITISVIWLGAFSSSATTKLPAPNNFTVNTIDNSVEISWDKVNDTSKYELFYMQEGTEWQSVFVEGTAYTITDISPNYTYFFQIRAFDKNNSPGCFSAVNKRWAVSKLSVPANFKLNTVDNTAEISWDEVNGASEYELFYMQAGTEWQSVFVEGATHTFIDVSPYYTYYFQIRAIDNNMSPGFFSSVIKKSITALLPSPQNIRIKTLNNSVKVSWDEVNEASKYELFYQQAGNGWKSVYVNGAEYTFNNINPKYTYYFQIRAYAGTNSPGYFSAVNTRLAMPVLGAMRNYKGILNINWSYVPGACKYYLWYKLSQSDNWICAPRATTNNYWNITNPKEGAVFSVKVHAVFPNNSYSISDIKDITCLVAPVYGINYSQNDKFNIHWNKVSGAEKYEVVRFYNGKSQKVYSGTNNYFEDKGTSAIGPYYYQVRALTNTTEGIWSSSVPVHYVPKAKRQQKIVELAHMEYGNKGDKYWNAMWKADEWCAMYAGWLLRETRANLTENGWHINVGKWADNLKRLGKWHNRGTYTPKVGDIIIFGTSQTWRTHVGIVIGVKDGYVYTSEGNATGQPYYASRVTEKVYSLSSSYIVGYGSVDY